jgi:hypothetical protein
MTQRGDPREAIKVILFESENGGIASITSVQE